MSKIGFIGLGLMGGAMVNRLQDQGHELTVLSKPGSHLCRPCDCAWGD